jgi:DNA-binding GntR family transcriptional regulator
VNDLRGILTAIKARDGDLAEKLARQDVMNAAAEIARLLEENGPAGRRDSV